MNCLKCGRTVAEGELLCPACSGRGAQQEPETKSHAQVHEPVTVNAEVSTATPEKKIRRLRCWLTAFVVVCLLLIGFTGLQFIALQNIREQAEAAQQAKIASELALSELQEELDATYELLHTAEEDLAQRNIIIASFEAQAEEAASSLP